MKPLGLIVWLAFRDWINDWPLSLCLLAAVTSAALPLILLLSLRAGVVEQLRNELTRFPSSRELSTTGQPEIRWQLAAQLGQRDDVAYAAPLTRLLAASATLRKAGGKAVAVDLLPSGPGDPLARGRRPGEVVLSDLAARDAGVSKGHTVQLSIGRVDKNGKARDEVVTMPVAAVIPGFASGRRLALIDPDLLLAAEIFRENETITTLAEARSLAVQSRERRTYSGLRLYARSIDDVDTVRRWLLDKGIATDGRFEEIHLLQRLDRATGLLVAILGILAAGGLLVSLAAAQWSWVERRRGDIGYLRLLGFEPIHITLMPIVQALLTVGGGLATAVALALLLDRVIDRMFAGQLGSIADVSRVGIREVVLVGILVLAAAISASLAASLATRRITPAEALRGVPI